MIRNMFSTVPREERGDGWLKLSYDEVVRVMMSSVASGGESPGGQPPGARSPDYLPLTGQGIISLACTTPDCVKGTPPVVKQFGELDVVAFSMEIQTPAHLVPVVDGQLCLLAGVNGKQVLMPVFAMSTGMEHALIVKALCQELRKYRDRAGIASMGFDIYQITDAVDMAELRHKWIAIPIPCSKLAASSLVEPAAGSAAELVKSSA